MLLQAALPILEPGWGPDHELYTAGQEALRQAAAQRDGSGGATP